MSTWKQELAEATTPLEGVNDIRATLTWKIETETDPFSPLPAADGGTIRISRTVQLKGVSEADARLTDGKNYIAGDHISEISYLKYLAVRIPLPDDPPIVRNGIPATLESVRPISDHYGIHPGVDTLTIGSDVWTIRGIAAVGMMNDETTGFPVPAKLRFTLRK